MSTLTIFLLIFAAAFVAYYLIFRKSARNDGTLGDGPDIVEPIRRAWQRIFGGSGGPPTQQP